MSKSGVNFFGAQRTHSYQSEVDLVQNSDEADQQFGARRNPDSYLKGKGFQNFKSRILQLSLNEAICGGVTMVAFVTVIAALIIWYQRMIPF